MSTRRWGGLVRQLHRTVAQHDRGGRTDGQLLEAFRARRDEAAFEALVRRHGPMVLGVCRRVLRGGPDVDDAFQATFLILFRRSHALNRGGSIANWLYTVAYHAALRARTTAARRQRQERQAQEMPRQSSAAEEVWRDLQPVLDEELDRLPA